MSPAHPLLLSPHNHGVVVMTTDRARTYGEQVVELVCQFEVVVGMVHEPEFEPIVGLYRSMETYGIGIGLIGVCRETHHCLLEFVVVQLC